jgi:uncharacterized RDD family membrane protein YckC
MICLNCGRDNPPDALYCQECGKPMNANQYQQQSGYSSPMNFAAIGPRFVALLIDGVIIGIPIGIISAILSAMMAVQVIHRTSQATSFYPGDVIGTFFAGFGLIMLISILLSWAYFSLMESSAWQGTLGKKMMGIQVTDLCGERISLGRATIRLAVKSLLSSWLFIGYIIAFFTQKRQSLHDLVAGTLVLTKQNIVAQQFYSCPRCGAILQPTDRFCSNCGQSR